MGTKSPHFIMIAMAVYSSGEDAFTLFEPDVWNSPASVEAFNTLRSEGMVDKHGRPTSKLVAWVAHLCTRPFPVSHWVIPEPHYAEGIDD